MFSFVDLRLALLLGAAVLLVRAQGEDDRKFHHCLLELLNSFFFFFSVFHKRGNKSGFSLLARVDSC